MTKFIPMEIAIRPLKLFAGQFENFQKEVGVSYPITEFRRCFGKSHSTDLLLIGATLAIKEWEGEMFLLI